MIEPEKPHHEPGISPIGSVELIQFQKIILENLFPQDWFSERRRDHHPAYQRWNLCVDLLKRGGIIQFPEQEASLPVLGRLALDSTVLITLTEGNFQQLKLGAFDLYGDSSVQDFIRSRVVDARQFEDVMVELAFGASHKSRGHSVEPMEIRNFPDMKILIPKFDLPFFVECKKIRSASSNRLVKEIHEANTQVKSVDTACYGVAILDVTEPVSAGRVEDDTLPPSLIEIIKTVQPSLHGNKNHSIGAAVLLWDDHMVFGVPPQNTLVVFRRRFHVIYHNEATQTVPREAPLFEGVSIAHQLFWSSRENQPRECEFQGDSFQKGIQDKFRINPRHAAETMMKSDRRESLHFNRMEIVLAARHIAKPQNDFYLLVCGEIKGEKYLVLWAYKIRCVLCSEIHLLSPFQLLTKFIETFGLPINIESVSGKLIVYHELKLCEADVRKVVKVENPQNHSYSMHALFRDSLEPGRSYDAFGLALCIDTTSYTEWLKV
jgi:hypothetical protein